MAARSSKVELSDSWKNNIRVSMLMNSLENHALGKTELSATQIKSIEVILSKTVPNLATIEQHNIDERDKLTEEEILSQAQALISAQPGLLDTLIAIRDAMTKTPALDAAVLLASAGHKSST